MRRKVRQVRRQDGEEVYIDNLHNHKQTCGADINVYNVTIGLG